MYRDKWQLFKTILLLAAPAILEMSLNTALMVADTIMVSWYVGKEALSSVGIANSIMFTLIFVFSSFNVGAIAMISRRIGEKKPEEAKRVAQSNIMLNLIIGVIVSLAAYSLKNLLFSPFIVSEQVRTMLHTYYDIVVVGMIFNFMSFAFAAISRGVGNTKLPMYITGISVLTNIVLNYLLILGVWLFPTMGIAGAALATTIARFVAFVIYLIAFFILGKPIRLKLSHIGIDRSVLPKLWQISLPGAVEQFLMQSAFFVMGIIIATLPTDSESLFRIVLNIESTSFMPAVGISIAAATLVGQSLGEGDTEKAYQIGTMSGVMGVVWGLFIGTVFLLFPQIILQAFTPESKLISMGLPIMFFVALNQPLLNYNIAMSGALRGAGDTSFIMRTQAMRLWLVFIPLGALAIMHFNAGIVGLWYAEIASFIIFGVVLFQRFNSQKWAQIKV